MLATIRTRCARILISYLSLALLFGSYQTAEGLGRVVSLAGRCAIEAGSLFCTNAYANESIDCAILGPDVIEKDSEHLYRVWITGGIAGSGGTNYSWSATSSDIPYDHIMLSVSSDMRYAYLECASVGTVELTCEVSEENSWNSGTAYRGVEVVQRRRFPIPPSKPAIWVNYADPRPKGKDADKGAKPSSFPEVSVNNVSLSPAVSHTPFTVQLPAGALNMTPTLVYSPPVLIKSEPLGISESATLSVSATPSEFGYCWSASLAPCVEKTVAEVQNGASRGQEYSMSVDGPAGSASFDGGVDPITSAVNFSREWEPQPLVRASYLSNDTVQFWGSGTIVASNGPETSVDKYNDDSTVSSRTISRWPAFFADRNGNRISFAYGETNEAQASLSYTAPARNPVDTSIRKAIRFTSMSNDQSGISIVPAYQNGLATALAQKSGATTVRSASFEYYTPPAIALPASTNYGDFGITLLQRVTMPDGTQVQYEYTNICYQGFYNCDVYNENQQPILLVTFNLPYISAIITTAGTTRIEYADFDWYGSSEQQRYEPGKVTVIHNNGLTTEIYEKTSSSYSYNYWHPAESSGTASMKTYTATSTVNEKSYRLTVEPFSKQWYGVETANTLDTVPQHQYTSDSRFRFTAAGESPNGTTFNTTSFAYDGYDNCVDAIDPLSNHATSTYANCGLDLVESRDPRGIVTRHQYDACGNRTNTIEDANGIARATACEYNCIGQVMRTIDPLGRPTVNFYSQSRTPDAVSAYTTAQPSANNCGWLVATRDPEGRVTTFSYDTLGRQTVVNAPGTPDHNSGRYVVTTAFDIMDRTVATHYPDGTFASNVYNTAGYPAGVLDRAGRWASNSFDAAGHVLRADLPNGDWIVKAYNGDLVTNLMDAASNQTTYHYDHEQLVGVIFPDGSKRAAGFDNLNRQLWAVDERGVAVENTYDLLGRVTVSEYAEFTGVNGMPPTVTSLPTGFTPPTFNADVVWGDVDQEITLAYDQVGNVLTRTDWTGSATNAYDGLGRATHQWTQYTTPVSASYSIGNTFDLANNRLRADYSINGGSAQTVTNAFDSLDRLVAVQHLNSGAGAGYAYDDNGKLGTMTYRMNGSGVATRSMAYDAEQRLATLTFAHSKDNDLALEYVYNSAQQITQINERAFVESTLLTTNRFSYDDRDQLVGEHRISDATSYQPLVEYAYDHAQNRLSRKARGMSGSTDDYAYAMANILTNITVGSPLANNRYSYDIAGNLATSVVNGAVAVFRYNAQNKLVRIEGEGFTNEFVYDSGSRRIGVRQNMGDYRLDIHDGSVCIASVVNGTIRQFFVRGVGIAEGTGDVIAEVAMPYGSTHFYVANHRGDTVMTLDNKWYGCIPECYLQYDAFGNPVSSIQYEGSFQPRYTFSTKEYLADAQLYLYAYRVYDPVAGRWTQRDPIDYQDSVNLYQFCGNNPVNAWDVDGRVALVDDAAIGAAIGIALVVGLVAVGIVYIWSPAGERSLRDSTDYVYQQARDISDAAAEQARIEYDTAKRLLQEQVQACKKQLQKLDPKDPRWKELWKKLKNAQQQVKEFLKRPRKDTNPHTDGRQPKGVGGNK